MTRKFTSRRCPFNTSDPVTLPCKCIPGAGTVLLFYRYKEISGTEEFAHYIQSISSNLTGKVRISKEGINMTVAGLDCDIFSFTNSLISHPFLSDLSLDSSEDYKKIFKPSPGCIHVFPSLSIKITDESCPFGVTPNNMRHRDSSGITGLEPEEFHHALINDSSALILDVRNYYESKIGRFENAITPPIRKFNNFPAYLESNKEMFNGKKIYTYCTGGFVYEMI